MPPPTSTSPDSHKGKRVLNFLYLDPGGVEGEMLSPVTSGLGWVRAAGSQGWVTDFLSLRLPTPAPACSHFALSASTVHRPGQISLLLKPSIASQSPGLSPDFTASCHTCHLASRGGHFSVSLLLYAVPTQSLVPATSTLPGAPSLCTPADSYHPVQLSNPQGGHEPKVHDPRPCWYTQREAVVCPGSSPQAAKIKHLETQAQVDEFLTAGPDWDDVTQLHRQ